MTEPPRRDTNEKTGRNLAEARRRTLKHRGLLLRVFDRELLFRRRRIDEGLVDPGDT